MTYTLKLGHPSPTVLVMIFRALGSRPLLHLVWCWFVALFAVLAVAPTAGAQTQTEAEDEVVLFVLDLSGSMNEPFDGQRTKLDVAKAAFVEAFASVSPDALVGLRVYGDQNAAAPPNARATNCSEDSRLVVPISELRREELIGEVQGFAARGDTSISLALESANADIPAGKIGTVVLFSDGRDECFDADLDGDAATGPSYGADPCAVAELIAIGGSVDRVMTVGFGADTAAEAELRCIASATGGSYTQIETPADARDVLPELLVELSTGRTAERLGDVAINGTPEREGAPTMLRLDDPASGSGVYTDSVTIGERKWYHFPEFGPGPTTLTATVFDLPAESGITFDMSMYLAAPETFLFRNKGDTDAGLPSRPSASIRCGECEVPNGPSDVYWLVHLRSSNPEVTGTFDLELTTAGPGIGGRPAGCQEPLECWYPPEIEARSAELRRLEAELDDWEQGQASSQLLAERSELRDRLETVEAASLAVEAKADEYEEILSTVPPKGKTFKLPLLLILGGLILAFVPVHKLKLKRGKKDNDETDGDDIAAPGDEVAVPTPTDPPAIPPTAVSADHVAAQVAAEQVAPVQVAEQVVAEPVAPAQVAPQVVEQVVAEQVAPAQVAPQVVEQVVAEPVAPAQIVEHGVAAEPVAAPAESVAAESAATATAVATVPEPGWYPDPLDPAQYRWWSGNEWTEHTGGDNAGGSA